MCNTPCNLALQPAAGKGRAQFIIYLSRHPPTIKSVGLEEQVILQPVIWEETFWLD